jgi:hypothetical protein
MIEFLGKLFNKLAKAVRNYLNDFEAGMKILGDDEPAWQCQEFVEKNAELMYQDMLHMGRNGKQKHVEALLKSGRLITENTDLIHERYYNELMLRTYQRANYLMRLRHNYNPWNASNPIILNQPTKEDLKHAKFSMN